MFDAFYLHTSFLDNGRQARKKQKSPTQKQPQSIFDSDSEPSTSGKGVPKILQ